MNNTKDELAKSVMRRGFFNDEGRSTQSRDEVAELLLDRVTTETFLRALPQRVKEDPRRVKKIKDQLDPPANDRYEWPFVLLFRRIWGELSVPERRRFFERLPKEVLVYLERHMYDATNSFRPTRKKIHGAMERETAYARNSLVTLKLLGSRGALNAYRARYPTVKNPRTKEALKKIALSPSRSSR